ncbi:MAG: hypothetical protein KDA61_21915 [Planctomycetales bacterium]|nr:hypothetical protein [Planctomycetales bacterium]
MPLSRPRFRPVTLLLVVALAGAVFALLRERQRGAEERTRIAARARLAMEALLMGEAAHLEMVAPSAQYVQELPEEVANRPFGGSAGLTLRPGFPHVLSERLGVNVGWAPLVLNDESAPSIAFRTDEEREAINEERKAMGGPSLAKSAHLENVEEGHQIQADRFSTGLDSDVPYNRRLAAIRLRDWMEVVGNWKPEGEAIRKPTMSEIQDRGYSPAWAEPHQSARGITWPPVNRAWPSAVQLESAVRQLLDLAADEEEDWKVRCCAIWTLGFCKPGASRGVRQELEAIPETPRVRAFILEAIARMGRFSYGPTMQYEPHYGWDALQAEAVKLAAGSDEIERERTASALRFTWFPGAMQSQAQTDAHYSLLKNNTPRGRGYAAEAIRWNFHLVDHHGQLEAVDRLLDAYRDEMNVSTRKKIAAEFTAMCYRHGPRALGMNLNGHEAIVKLFPEAESQR